jgi:hypothetical protein
MERSEIIKKLSSQRGNGKRRERMIDRKVEQLEVGLIKNHHLEMQSGSIPLGARPILVKFTAFFIKLDALKNTRNLAGTSIRVEVGLSQESRKTREERADPIPEGCQEERS